MDFIIGDRIPQAGFAQGLPLIDLSGDTPGDCEGFGFRRVSGHALSRALARVYFSANGDLDQSQELTYVDIDTFLASF